MVTASELNGTQAVSIEWYKEWNAAGHRLCPGRRRQQTFSVSGLSTRTVVSVSLRLRSIVLIIHNKVF